MRNVDILYGKYLAEDRKTKTIGGVQTYITDLSEAIAEMGGRARVVQLAEEGFKCELTEKLSVEGFAVDGRSNAERCQGLFDAAVRTRGGEDRLTIFATDTIIPKRVVGDCIAIQHGIFWDVPRGGSRPLIRQVASRALAAYKTVERLNRVGSVVCVDYNFLNWYRTQVDRVVGYASVIPNYTHIAPRLEKPRDSVNIIFARRLFDYRGTRVFTEAVERLLEESEGISVTIAGSGPDEQWMRERLGRHDKVSFIHYESHESLEIHRDKHIAVVPTVGSEGTSLSLLEAMSAQCAAVCTNVGGMTNIVLDGYNGLLVNSGSAEQLYAALKRLIGDPALREELAENGYRTVRAAFSHKKWVEKWKKVLTEFEKRS